MLKILLGACLFLPLVFSSAFIFPFTVPKSFLFRILVELGFAFYFYLVLRYKELRPKMNILFWAVCVFVVSWFISAFAGVGLSLSFWGNLERMMGVWGLLHFVLFFVMASAIFSKKDWDKLFKISVAVSLLVSLLGILQRFTDLGALMPQDTRIFSTIGNAGFLGTYLLFNIFIAGYLLSKEKDIFGSKNSAFLWPAMIFQFLALIYSGTRGAFLGLAAGVGFFLMLFAINFPGKKRRMAICILSGTALALVLFFVVGSYIFSESSALGRLANISFKDGTAQNRIILWQKSFLAWKEKPVFGWGPENNELALDKYSDATLNQYNAWYDRAHNFVFDYAVSGGLLGFLSYLFLVGAFLFFSLLFRKDIYFSLFFSSALAAYLVQNLFIFDTFISFLMLFFVFAAINSRFSGLPEKIAQSKKNLKPLLAGALAFIFFLVYSLNIKPLLAADLAADLLDPSVNTAGQINSIFEKILGLKTFASPEIVYQSSFNYLEKIAQDPQLAQNEEFFTEASGQLKDNILSFPLRSGNYIALAWLDLYFSGRDPSRVSEAIELAQKAKELSGVKKEPYIILVAAYSLENNSQKAYEQVLQARSIDQEMGAQVQTYFQSINK